MTEGLTTTGLVVDTTDQTLAKIEGDELSTIDQALDTSPEEPLGQLNGIIASDRSLAAQLLQAIYGALDPESSEGQQLDVVCALSGTVRNPARSTIVYATGTGTATSLAAATLDADGNVATPGAVLAQIAGHPELGSFTNIGIFLGTTVTLGTPWNPSAGQTAIFMCTTTGNVACNAGTLTVISPPVSGLSSITNAADGVAGAPVESDAALRLRRLEELVPPDGGTVDSMRETLKQVKGSGPGLQGVIEAFVFENPTNATDSNGLPPHSTLAVIWDGSIPQAANNDIAKAIWKSKGSGITAYDAGSGLSGVAIDSAGKSHTVGFARASQLTIYINITVAVDSTFDTVNGPAAIQALLATYGNTLVQGQKVVVLDFTAQAREGIQGVRDVTVFQIDSHSSPTNTANIAVGITQIARFDTSRIVVSTTPFT